MCGRRRDEGQEGSWGNCGIECADSAAAHAVAGIFIFRQTLVFELDHYVKERGCNYQIFLITRCIDFFFILT